MPRGWRKCELRTTSIRELKQLIHIYTHIKPKNKFMLVGVRREPVMPVASNPRNFVMGKRWVTLVWSKSLSYTNLIRIIASKHFITVTAHTNSANSWKYEPVILTGTFFWVTTHTESFPRTPMEVIPADFTALNAYSIHESQIPNSETVIC